MGTAWKYALDGKMRMSRQLSSTSFQDKANQWKFTWGTGCSVPLLYSRGSNHPRLPRQPILLTTTPSLNRILKVPRDKGQHDGYSKRASLALEF
jgi:hypothetical protein